MTREALHERVRRHARALAAGARPDERFDALALDVAMYQAANVPGYARLLAAHGVELARATSVAELPAVPTDAFRVLRVAAHAQADDAIVFRTSGTTTGLRGEHALSTVATYEEVAALAGHAALFEGAPERLELALLAPPVDEAPDSSLGFMLALFARRFASAASHHLREGRLDVAGLARAAERGAPLGVLGTSFAFVHLLDALEGRRLALAPGSFVMHTGGFKGRSREVPPAELRRAIADAFDVADDAVVGEYGMTELSSQLYEANLRRSRGLAAPKSTRHGVFFAPGWMRVRAVDPTTLAPLPPGGRGVLRFEDLANVDSAIAVQTADVGVVLEDGGVALEGRSPGAPPRGCSLAIDELLGGAP